MIDDEIFCVDVINVVVGIVVFVWGCVDMVLVLYEVGVLIWFYEDWVIEDMCEYVIGEIVNVKLLSCISLVMFVESFVLVDLL